jgi:nicotinate-nucleotide pyrophosphorylase (carboxylating)
LAGWRLFEQQAVVDGGGSKHRFNLGTAVMIKDNHVVAMGGSMTEVIRAVKNHNGHTVCIEVEVDTLEQLTVVLDEGVDVVLLDNMTPDQIRQAVAMIHGQAKPPIIEVSGGITLQTAASYAEAGAQIISTSQITMGALPLDIGLDF